MTTTIHDDLGDVHIVTNNVPRPVIDIFYEQGEGWRHYTEADNEQHWAPDAGFEYRGFIYALQEFSITRSLPETSPFKRFDAFQPSSAFDGIGIRYTDDFESVVVAHVHW